MTCDMAAPPPSSPPFMASATEPCFHDAGFQVERSRSEAERMRKRRHYPGRARRSAGVAEAQRGQRNRSADAAPPACFCKLRLSPTRFFTASAPPALRLCSARAAPPLRLRCASAAPALHLRLCCGFTLAPLRSRSGSAPAPLWLHSGSAPAPLRLRSVSVLPARLAMPLGNMFAEGKVLAILLECLEQLLLRAPSRCKSPGQSV